MSGPVTPEGRHAHGPTQALTGVRYRPSLTHRHVLLHTQTHTCTDSCPEMYPQTHGPTHMRTHAHPETHGHMHTCVKTHPGRGLGSDAEERSRSRHAQLGLPPRAQGPEPFPSWGMSSTPREQHDQQLPPPQPTRPPPSPALGRASSRGGQGAAALHSLPSRATPRATYIRKAGSTPLPRSVSDMGVQNRAGLLCTFQRQASPQSDLATTPLASEMWLG